MNDTIYATSSGTPPAAIAIIRVSGPAAFDVVIALAGTLPKPRQATLRAVRDPNSGRLLDRALILAFPAPHTATGEDLVEFHVHGGRAVVAAVQAAIATLSRTRHAEPGEFTRRALENGVIDLTATEGLGDLLSAQTETQRRAALRMAEGGLRVVVDGWTDRLVDIAARIEAQLDFSDEDEVTDEPAETIVNDIALIASEISLLLAAPAVERLHDGVRIVIAGPPNSGKSTLLNALVQRDVAIVSPISGTTRDRIEASVARDGVAYLLTDTAGITDTPNDDIEQIGIDRAHVAIAGADIVLWLNDSSSDAPNGIRVHARADLPGRRSTPNFADVAVSAVSGMGIDTLWSIIALRARSLIPQDDTTTTNARQRALLKECVSHLVRSAENDLLIVAEEVRGALRALDAVAGRANIEAVLDTVFAKFCIGK